MATRQTSLRKMLAFWLGAMIVLPTLPLAVITWYGYRNEVRQFERQLQETNRQFTVLGGMLLGGILLDVAQRLERVDLDTLKQGDLPFDHAEIVSTDGILLASTLNPEEIGKKRLDSHTWRTIQGLGSRPFEITDVANVPGLDEGRVLLRVAPMGNDEQYRIGVLAPDYLRYHLTSRFQSLINRHIYAIDTKGTPIFYSHPELTRSPDQFRRNRPVQVFLEGKEGPVGYKSALSGRNRLGYVSLMPETGWGIVASADIVESMLDIRDRFTWLIVVLIVSGALALLIFFLFSSRLVFPLSELARDIRKRDRDLHAPVKAPESIDRIRELSQLVEDLNAYIDHCVAAERKTVQAEKMATLGELTTGLAHELGTPLNVIRGRAQWVKRKIPGEAETQVALDGIVRQTERITGLIRNLLDIARLKQVTPEYIDLRHLLQKAWNLAAEMHPGVRCEFSFPDTDVTVYARRRPMEHAVLNLFTNACQAMGGEGRLFVRIERPDVSGPWRIEIEDTGPGIPPEHLGEIFKPFFSTKSAGEGSGLGLALVERVIRENGGSVSALSESGKGAVFEITLPYSSDPASKA